MNRAIPETLEMIGALIERPSVSCTDPHYDQSNLAVIHLLAEWLGGLGFSVEIRAIGDRKANLIATLGSREDPTGLVLSGHTDTVPCDPELWSSDPFKAVEKDGRIYGLGSADMKSFFALALEAANRFEAKDFRHPLVILATADEESSMSGVKSLVADNVKLGRYAVIGEPTGLKPIRMHKGVMLESIVVRGKAGHSSDPSLGANAIDGMHAVLSELLAFRAELRARHRNPAFKVDYPTLNLGSIHGGDNPNRICAHCETQIDIRPLPGMELEDLHEKLVKRLEPVLAQANGLSLEIRRMFEGLPPFESDANGEIVRCCEELSGYDSGAVAFGTEAPFLKRLGLQTVVMGPGHIEQAHQPDEYLPMTHIRAGTDILSRLIERFCIRPEA
ncbi:MULTISPECIES: acetylornithine deacetylase [Methylocaldum]|uniref:acetylornithine deacetylase n=1 Tax=unclassified Methylocaldum TaxID=2622260 RepID=UPI000A3252F2|nr:acetylornithine deacetylase [Methylocaldum sp. RMAD-M]MVF20851.1 acetylornithine deacetylase [Methylocaldum sp. BRCS4]